MPEPTLPLDALAVIDAACDRFESAWRAAGGQGPCCEAFAAEVPDGLRDDALRELFAIERLYRAKRGESVAAWASGRPQLEALASEPLAEAATLSCSAPASSAGGLLVRCPQCQSRVDLAPDAPLDQITCKACGSAFGVTGGDPDLEASGRRQIGRFLLRQRLGSGGFGTVWRAWDPQLDRDVAIKAPRREVLSPQEAELFFREARAAAQLAHPGIVSVYEVGRDAGGEGSIYIVSELVDGQPLSERLKDWRPTRRQAAAITADLADALDYAHSRGVIHRDLKPANILLDRFSPGGETASAGLADLGRPRLVDFGLAKRDTGEITMTIDGQVLGTPAYMSPEQASGQVRWVDRRTDVYSLGVTLFRMLTGELPYRGTATSQIQQRLVDDAPSPRRLDDSVPIDLATVCLKCLERDPTKRYATAAEVAAEMRRYLAGEPVLARPLSPWGRAGRWARRRPAAAAALALGAALAVGGPTAAVVIGRQAQKLEAQVEEYAELIAEQAQRVDAFETAKDQDGVRATTAAPDAIRRFALQKLLARDGDRLLREAERLPADDPEGARARLAVARLLVAAGQGDRAALLLEQVSMAPDVPNAGSGPSPLAQSLRRAEALRDGLRDGAAIGPAAPTVVQQALTAATPPPLPAGELTADDLMALANVLLSEGPTSGDDEAR